jgi:sulfide:quinone oxidoreductase
MRRPPLAPSGRLACTGMSASRSAGKLRILIAGAGVAALEAALALHDLAAQHVATTVLAPAREFVYRPMAVREPFAYPRARRYPVERIVADAGGELLHGELAWLDPPARVAHTSAGTAIEYDALIIALGGVLRPRYEHALTIDDRRLDETLAGLLQDVEGGYARRIAFVSPGRMAWQLPIYELALMTAGRAYDSGLELETTIVTPEDSPLAIFGERASRAVAEALERRGIETVTSAYAEVPGAKEVVVNPGDRRIQVDRIVALPELYGPPLRGLPLAEHGFIHVDQYMQVPDAGPVYAAGDAIDFQIKHGGLASEQADVAATQVAALAGADVQTEPFTPVIRGMLLTDSRPIYLTARITGGQGFSSVVSDTPTWSPPSKIAARYLGPYLDELDRRPEAGAARSGDV